LGDSDKMQIGHWVLAIGSPFDLAGSVTHGIISGKGRRSLKLGQSGVLNQDFFQTDAAINPGNSGGPLVNLRGEVVGINTAIASQSGGSEGVGFTIPVNLVRRVAAELIQKGVVTRAYLGIDLDPPLDPPRAIKLGLPRVRGALVNDVFSETPAAVAGLRRFDVVLEFNGKMVHDMEHLTHMISMTPVGEEVSLVLWRDRQEKKLLAKVGDRAKFDRQRPSERAIHPFPKLGIDVEDLTEAHWARFNLNGHRGVLVARVHPHSAVAQNLEPFDVIDSVDGQAVSSVAEFTQIVRGVKPQDGVRMHIVRPSTEKPVVMEVVLKL
jgi:serine protease Do